MSELLCVLQTDGTVYFELNWVSAVADLSIRIRGDGEKSVASDLMPGGIHVG